MCKERMLALWDRSYRMTAGPRHASGPRRAHDAWKNCKGPVMNYLHAIRASVLLAAFGVAGAFGQTPPTPAPGLPEVGPARPVTDVGPAPAEERDSIGAIVLETSPVRAQREAFRAR